MLLFDGQLTELLEEVKPKKKTASGRKLEELLRLLKETLLSLPSSPQVDVKDALVAGYVWSSFFLLST